MPENAQYWQHLAEQLKASLSIIVNEYNEFERGADAGDCMGMGGLSRAIEAAEHDFSLNLPQSAPIQAETNIKANNGH